MKTLRIRFVIFFGFAAGLFGAAAFGAGIPQSQADDAPDRLLQLLDAPLLFVKRHSYTGIHIYDTYYKWPPGGGGIYVLENPCALREERNVRAVIDPGTPETLGTGVYSHPELSWDAKKLLFCFKGEPAGNTSIYEIGIDGRGLRRVTDPGPTCLSYKGSQHGQHDIAPAYLPDGRIVFLSTRPSGLVPCNNTGVAILHVMNADGSDLHSISVNNVNEFDPSVLSDGRILFGRWEYVDKNALTIQSLWTMHPDGSEETAFFANNMVFPEALLDARAVPGSALIVATLAKHNAPPRGSIGFIDPRRGKNNPAAIANLEHPQDPTYDRGDSCEPWPLSESAVIFSGRPQGAKRNAIEMMDRSGRRIVVVSDPEICLHSPMLVKPRVMPPVVSDVADRSETTGRFFVQDIYQGLEGVRRGEVKWLRLLEETSRISGSTMGGSPYNQTFLVSAALAFSVKNYLGVVPVQSDGSVYFEAPSGRALFLQALDSEGRLVQSMRTFVQAAPGVTRSCVGCHEHKASTPAPSQSVAAVLTRAASRPQPETWGSGYIDYPSMIQPLLDQHCVDCHGGENGIAADLDLSGGWTEHFNISYEHLVNRRESQLVAWWIAGIDCMNGTAHWSSQIFPPRAHGSGAAPLARLLVEGHSGYIPNLTRSERDLLMAWIDSNGLYYGTWDSTENGCAVKNWQRTKQALIAEMESAGCTRCHGGGDPKALVFESDWFNLQNPELSRILRAPLVEGQAGFGLGLCRDRRIKNGEQRIRLLVDGYAHAVKPIEDFPRRSIDRSDPSGAPQISFASTDDPHYQAMLAIIRTARTVALSSPRIDMPGARILPGEIRQFIAMPFPDPLPELRGQVESNGGVRLSWGPSAELTGFTFELHRGPTREFKPADATRIAATTLSSHVDLQPGAGTIHYALVLRKGEDCSQPVRASVRAPEKVSREARAAQAELASFNFRAVRLAIEDLSRTFGARYPKGAAFLAQLERLEETVRELRFEPSAAPSLAEQLQRFSREAMLSNPLLDFDKLLLVRRKANRLGLPANWQGNASLPRSGFDNEIALFEMSDARVRESAPAESIKRNGNLATVYRPAESSFVGDIDLHFDGDRLLFSSIGSHNRWQVFEIRTDGTGLRQVTPGDQPDVDNYDACYLPDGAILFTSTAPMVGVPCVDGSDPVANLFRLGADGHSIRQLCFDQDHNWCPTLLSDGRVLYQRWEYADIPHSQSRLLFQMNPDGTGQTEFYGSNSYWPNALFYARPIPGHATKVVAIVSGHHGVPRMGELVIFNPAKGRQEADGVVQRIPGYGSKVEPVIRDQLVDASWPKFLHPYPLSEHYVLVSAKPSPEAPWGIYLVDVFDNMLLLAEAPGEALLEPLPLRQTSCPPVIPTRVDHEQKDAVVLLSDIYQGDGLKGVPRGTIKALRVFGYHWSFQGMGGLLGTVGLDGPWDIRRILGTVPVESDGSAYFRVPANTPIAVQPLDAEGKAVQVMRSWFTAMPGEHVSCVGCHARQNDAPANVRTMASLNRAPAMIQPWHGPARGFSYAREVQPVIDQFCVGCHDGQPFANGEIAPDLRGTQQVADFHLTTPGRAGKHGGKFSVGYAQLHRFVRRPGIESDYHMLAPMEYHADTTELVQMLRKGHHGVRLDAGAWDRLITWIDLNAPYHGTWSEEIGDPGAQSARRHELRKRYTGTDDPNPETVEWIASAPAAFVEPSAPVEPLAPALEAKGWPFGAAEAVRRQAVAGVPVRRTIELGDGIALDLVLVPAGEFVMGDQNGAPDERPLSRVRIDQAFWMARTEINNRQFAQFDSSHDSRVESKTAYQFGIHGYPVNEPDQPVVRVSWEQAEAFCAWLSSRTGQRFALPTEAQWEYACRAGSALAFSFGGLEADFSPFANLADAKLKEFASDPYTVSRPLENPTPYEDYIPKDVRFNDGGVVTMPTGSYLPNAWGLHDLHGNVAEWTRSAYRAYPYADEDGRNNDGLEERRVVRGGSWRDRPVRARASFRTGYHPWQCVFNVGFRVICEIGEPGQAPVRKLVSNSTELNDNSSIPE